MAEEKAIAKLTKEKIDLNAQMQVMQSKMKAMEIELKEAKAKVVDAKSQLETAAAAAAGKAREGNHGRGLKHAHMQCIHSFSFIVCDCMLALCMGIALLRGCIEPAASFMRSVNLHRG